MDKITILLVDDDVDFLFQMQMQMEKVGYAVITAENQKDAEAAFKSQKPDLAIFDLMMENEDSGFILTYKFKRMYPDVPVIISTAVTAETGIVFNSNATQEKNWIKADKYLEKGASFEQINLSIKKLLKL